jgi:hypothetical protein
MLVALLVSAALASSSGATGANALPLADPLMEESDPQKRFFPFALSDDAEQPVRDGFILSQVLGICCGGVCLGNLWGPLLAVKGGEINTDVVVSFLVPWLVTWGVSTAAALVLGLVTGGVGGILVLPITLVGSYLTTNATLMAMDRNLKSKNGPAPPKRSRNEPAQPGASDPAAPPPPSYAY